jgi:hypothetical protein
MLAAQDGTITFEIKLTGELSTNLLSEGEGPKPTHGTLVGPGVNAQVSSGGLRWAQVGSGGHLGSTPSQQYWDPSNPLLNVTCGHMPHKWLP